MKKLFILFILFITGLSFTFLIRTDEPVFVPPSPQRTGGDSAKGYDYLINGDYIRGGVPEMVFRKTIGKPTIYLGKLLLHQIVCNVMLRFLKTSFILALAIHLLISATGKQ
jgi:hypothetical protein